MPKEVQEARPPTLVLKRPPWRVVVLGICITVFSFGLIDGWLGTGMVKDEGGVRILLLPVVLTMAALLGLELYARKNHRLEIAKGGEARLTELGSLYDLGTALRKLGTVKVDDRL